jgi:hypothetical protein
MTVLNPYASRFDEIAANYAHQFETRSEFEERVDLANRQSGWWFDEATKPQKAAYLAAIHDLTGNYSPRSNRAREAAKAAFYLSTAAAAELTLRAFEDHLRDGEIAPETAEAFEALAAPVRNAHVAEPFRTILNAIAGVA